MTEEQLRTIIREENEEFRQSVREIVIETVEEIFPKLVENIATKTDIETINARLNIFDQRFNYIDQYLKNLNEYIRGLDAYFQTVNNRLNSLEVRVSTIEASIKQSTPE